MILLLLCYSNMKWSNVMKEIKIQYKNEFGDIEELIISEYGKEKEFIKVVINWYQSDLPSYCDPDMMSGYFNKEDIIKMAKQIVEEYDNEQINTSKIN